jgi:hypothetical protein
MRCAPYFRAPGVRRRYAGVSKAHTAYASCGRCGVRAEPRSAMTDRALEQRLYAAAHALDSVAPRSTHGGGAASLRAGRWRSHSRPSVGAAVQPSASAVTRFLG